MKLVLSDPVRVLEVFADIRRQKNSRNNYDLVTGTIEILKSYYYNACINGMYNNITKCFNTIIEFV